jgi:hypothetical protein
MITPINKLKKMKVASKTKLTKYNHPKKGKACEFIHKSFAPE